MVYGTDTTFAPWQQDNGHVVLNTKPKILCCDLRLSPGESKTCKFFYKYLSTKKCTPESFYSIIPSLCMLVSPETFFE